MKFICWGDLHSHSFSEFSEKDEVTGNSRLTGILKTLDYMKDYCLDNDIEYMLGAGDIFHKRSAVDTEVYNFTYNKIKEISEAGIKFITTVGNHDQYSNKDCPEHSLEAFKEIPNVTVLDRFTPYEVDDVTIYPVPYSKNVQMVKNKIENYVEHSKGNDCSILLMHLGISGATVGKSAYAMQDAFGLGDLYPEVFDFGIAGHYHKRQFLGETKNYAYTGSPLPHNFNDTGEFGFVEIDTDQDSLIFHDIPSPKFLTITGQFDEEELKGNYVRFQMAADKIESLTQQIPDGVKHRIEPQKEYKTEKRVDIDHSMSEAEVIKSYCKKFSPEAEETLLEILGELN